MKRTVLVGVALGLGIFSAAGSASAFEWKGDNSSGTHGISVFADEPMGGGETAQVLSPAAPPPKDAPAAPPPKLEAPLLTEPGFVFQLGSGMRYLGGGITQDVDVAGAFFDFDARIGVYLNQHVGVFAGAEVGAGSLMKGCAGDCSDAVRFAFPVTVQVAFVDRVRGPYVEGGLVLAPTYMGATPSDSASLPETLKVSAPVDGRLGVGYRIPVKSAFGGLHSALDLHFGLDFGKFASVDYGSVAGDVSGDIASSESALHYAFALDLDWHFAL